MIKVVHGDITELEVDCIVNAARPSLLGGGGVDGAIHSKAGSELREFCKTLGGCKGGEAKITPGFNLKAKYIIHTVGPRYLYGSSVEIEKLKSCYANTLKIFLEKQIQSICFPNISTGAYGFPKEQAAEIAIQTITEFVEKKSVNGEIIFCCYDDENYSIYKQKLKQ
jgi:O-acetyl-ADP-ribose deacetylase (regulator of RNase III)